MAAAIRRASGSSPSWRSTLASSAWPTCASISAALAPLLERYRAIYEKYEPADARYLSNHRGHLMFLRPEEQEVCTAELIRTVTFTGTRLELQARLRELASAGYNHFAIRIAHGHPEMLEEWADVFAGV